MSLKESDSLSTIFFDFKTIFFPYNSNLSGLIISIQYGGFMNRPPWTQWNMIWFLIKTTFCPAVISLSPSPSPSPAMLPLLFLLILLFFPLTFSLNEDGLYLQQVKLSLSDPSLSLSSWNSRDNNPCKWFGITCDSATQQVTSVDLANSQLSGPFPSSLCLIPSLSYLSFSNNSINSSLTPDIAQCRSLLHLNLSQNLFVGSIPDALSQIPNLRLLDLSGNNFSGGIPASFGQFRQLEYLILVDNLLNGTIPISLVNISSLKELQLAYNPFTPGRIPSEIGNLTSLEVLWLSNCNLVGQIPPSLGRLSRLENLDLSTNDLSGTVPDSFSDLRSVVQIELYMNSLSGVFPTRMSNLSALRRIDISTNEFTGTIPEELCSLELESLNCYENRFEGSLPESLSRSPYLSELRLFNNKLSGALPRELGKNSPLQNVDVSYNTFSGEIPESLCSKGMLEELILIYNSFSGQIPVSLEKCTSLSRVRLRNNNLSGEVPEELWGLPHIYLLDLVQNSLVGSISKMIYGSQNLSILLLSQNSFSGSIPDEMGSLNNLHEFSGSDNKFSGRLPGSLVKLSQLAKLDLSDNSISGEIPAGIQALKRLNELNMANNNLSGTIPNEIGKLPVLNYLDLSNNRLSGKIPLELQNVNLNLLNLSNNLFTGDLPPLYAKSSYENSFLGNPELCNDLPDLCSNSDQTKNRGLLWIFLFIFILSGCVFAIGLIWFYWKYRAFKKNKRRTTLSKWKSFHRLGFSEDEIIQSLNEGNVIGSGASGKVYKAILRNGEVVAVKRLWEEAKKDEISVDSEKDGFEAEVETLGKIRHKSIVRLWCCYNSGNYKLLVYEYMPNGSLGDLLHGSRKGSLDWPTRYKVAIDAAEGLCYLHHDCLPPVIHRDIKSNNILLDAEFGAKVSDFGVAKFLKLNKRAESMSAIAGSWGYIAPEYGYTLRVNEKSDIYSFGVVILELVTGRPPNHPDYGEKDLVKWAYSTLNEKGEDQVIDSRLESKYKDEISRVLSVGFLCTSSLPINRPSMRKVVKLLQEASSEAKSTSFRKKGTLSPYYNADFSDL